MRTISPLPESPVGRARDLDGQVLLLGVCHDADTTLHLAELIAGVPYRVQRSCTVVENGRAVRVHYGENDHCCERFALAIRPGRDAPSATRLERARLADAHPRQAERRLPLLIHRRLYRDGA